MTAEIEQDDELLEIFLEESREHLDGIEEDLLAIEEGGAEIDDDLVNKVFRAAHSVKGAAGFFGLDNVKELAHAMENLLGLVRNRELVPTKEIVGHLLEASDELVGMLNNIGEVATIDISSIMSKLKAALTGALPEEKKQTVEETAEIVLSGGNKVFTINAYDLQQAPTAEKGGLYTYVLEYDLLNDIERKNKTPLEVMSELSDLVQLIDAKVDFEAIGLLDSFSTSTSIPFFALICSQMDPAMAQSLLELPLEQIHQIQIQGNQGVEMAHSLEADPPMETEVEEAPAPEPAPETTAVAEPAKPEVAPAAPAPAAAPPAAPPVAKAQPRPRKEGKSRKANTMGSKTPETSIRVKLELLDKLMTLAGELVLTRNQLVQSVGVESETDMAKMIEATQRIDLVTTELQDAIMSTRMQSIGIVFHRFRRLVRDVTENLGKNVDLVLEGEDVELDKTIIEMIGDPLTHLVRNSLDHGIETPDDRQTNGKPRTGTLRLSAYHKAGNVIIEIEDDGKGIDPKQIKKKAHSQGLYTMDQLNAMSDQALVKLIFKPGFSLAQQVTDLSGRGVGMDVVHSNLSKLGGVVDVESMVGQGTIIRVKLPLTLAIIPCLLVTEEGERFAIPQANLVELHRIRAADVRHKIERLGDAHVMRLRGELLPLIRLRDVLGMAGRSFREGQQRLADQRVALSDRRSEEGAAERHPERRWLDDRRLSSNTAVNVAIVAAGDFHFGLILESLQDSSEIVVKPLGRHFRNCSCYAGATILGNGRTALILDVIGISKAVRSDETTDAAAKEAEAARAQMAEKRDSMTVLLVNSGLEEQYAIPLGLVERIERITKDQIVYIAGKRTMTYRDRSLLLFTVDDQAAVSELAETDKPYVIIYSVGGREVGLLVSNLVDIIDSTSEVDAVTHRQQGIYGSTLIDGDVTLLLDLHEIASVGLPQQIESSMAQQVSLTAAPEVEVAAVEEAQRTVLVVEDSRFFLSKIAGFVEEAGYQALTAMDGVAALDVLEQNIGTIDLVLTDIEMPRLDGFGFTQRMRGDSRFRDIPVIAVTSVMGEEAEQRGRDVGIDEYIIKLDREMIMDRAEHFLANGR